MEESEQLMLNRNSILVIFYSLSWAFAWGNDPAVVSIADLPCGVRCSYFLLKLYDVDVSLNSLAKQIQNQRRKSNSLLDLKRLIENYGIECEGIKIKSSHLRDGGRPCIVSLHTQQRDHFVVTLGFNNPKQCLIIDPPTYQLEDIEYLLESSNSVALRLPPITYDLDRIILKNFPISASVEKSSDETYERPHLIEITPNQIDLGNVAINGHHQIIKQFKIKNISTHTVTIESIESSCGCIASQGEGTILLPDEVSSITLSITPPIDEYGERNYYSSVSAKNEIIQSTELIEIHVNYISPIGLTMNKVYFGRFGSWEIPKPISIGILKDRIDSVCIKEVETLEDWVECDFENDIIKIAINDDKLSVGKKFGTINVVTNMGSQHLPVFADIIGRVSFIPKPLMIENIVDAHTEFYIKQNMPGIPLRFNIIGLPEDRWGLNAIEKINDYEKLQLELKKAYTSKENQILHLQLCDEKGDIQDLTPLMVFNEFDNQVVSQTIWRGMLHNMDRTLSVREIKYEGRYADNHHMFSIILDNSIQEPLFLGIELSGNAEDAGTHQVRIVKVHPSYSGKMIIEGIRLPKSPKFNYTFSFSIAANQEIYMENGVQFIDPAGEGLGKISFSGEMTNSESPIFHVLNIK
ncbi:DUF1573 domain-containing protein [Candidatus Sumerlaeota bacterium]|nr:DUF1573 domain-containing protein [Candidatus Sumerlaeota bacterium]